MFLHTDIHGTHARMCSRTHTFISVDTVFTDSLGRKTDLCDYGCFVDETGAQDKVASFTSGPSSSFSFHLGQCFTDFRVQTATVGTSRCSRSGVESGLVSNILPVIGKPNAECFRDCSCLPVVGPAFYSMMMWK